MISEYKEKLFQKLKSSNFSHDENLISKAIYFAVKYHKGQLRESGQPFFHHPLEVAILLADIKLDTATIVTGILHDTIEDTELTFEDINQHFGSDIAKLVDGVSKLNTINFNTENLKQAENFRKLLIAMSDDIRVLFVKLCDRLHNMRTIKFIKSHDKQYKIALETLEIYAPLAERIGIYKIKQELQDISFKIIQPAIYTSIIDKINVFSENSDIVQNIIEKLKNIIDTPCSIYGRQKTPYSIWMKMLNKNINFENLNDFIGLRIIVNNKNDCYKILGIIHSHYQMIPNGFQDFISTPKNNGYQSLHTTIMGPNQNKIEIQIRTKHMHKVAELGVAAHWCYKQGYKFTDKKYYRWIRELLYILENNKNIDEFLQHTKLAMYYNQVFCFDKDGNIVSLPKGATILDFAYAIHSEVGNHCVAAEVNSINAPILNKINNGDQIKIITDKSHYPNPSVMNYLVTGKAKAALRKFTIDKEQTEYIKLGKLILDYKLSFLNTKSKNFNLKHIIHAFNKKNINDLFLSIGNASLLTADVIKVINEKYLKKSFLSRMLSKYKKVSIPININNFIPEVAIHLGKCCLPSIGEEICGALVKNQGLIIHKTNCKILSKNKTYIEKIPLIWNKNNEQQSNTKVEIILKNDTGTLAIISEYIALRQINITNISMSKYDSQYSRLLLNLQYDSFEKLEQACQDILSNDAVYSVKKI